MNDETQKTKDHSSSGAAPSVPPVSVVPLAPPDAILSEGGAVLDAYKTGHRAGYAAALSDMLTLLADGCDGDLDYAVFQIKGRLSALSATPRTKRQRAPKA